MKTEYLTEEYIHKFIDDALTEDIGDGDHSTLSTIPADQTSRARLIIKDDGVVAGLELAAIIFKKLDPDVRIDFKMKDGDHVKNGDIGFEMTGKTRALLSGERLMLNLMQRLSGIATHAHKLTKLVEGTSTKILDTRKTTPNLRPFEKWAVTVGGATNHRFGLFDMVMLKDNHIDFAGGIFKAVTSTKAYLKGRGKDLKIEVETRTLAEVKEALDAGADVIMLDNMSNEMMKQAVELIDGQAKTEASGGITDETISGVAQTGVDYISVGALTHSVKSLDISLKAIV